MGRWSPSGSDDYVRTYRALIRDLMGRVRRAVSLGEAASFAEEDEAIDDARIFAGRLGAYPDAELAGAANKQAVRGRRVLVLGVSGTACSGCMPHG